MNQHSKSTLSCLLIALIVFAFFAGFVAWRFFTMDISLSPTIVPRPFDAKEWMAWSEDDMRQHADLHRAYARREMLDDLLLTHNFDGWTEDQLKSLLGQPSDKFGSKDSDDDWDMFYMVGNDWVDYVVLVFHFDDNGLVDRYTVRMY